MLGAVALVDARSWLTPASEGKDETAADSGGVVGALRALGTTREEPDERRRAATGRAGAWMGVAAPSASGTRTGILLAEGVAAATVWDLTWELAC